MGNEMPIPTAVIMSGKYIASGISIKGHEVDETTSAAQVDSAKEPKRLAPIPAMSPTLSPTLSVIVFGLMENLLLTFCLLYLQDQLLRQLPLCKYHRRLV